MVYTEVVATLTPLAADVVQQVLMVGCGLLLVNWYATTNVHECISQVHSIHAPYIFWAAGLPVL